MIIEDHFVKNIIENDESIQKIINKKDLNIFDWFKLYKILNGKALRFYSCQQMHYDSRMSRYVKLRYQSKICLYRMFKKIGIKYNKLEEGNYYD